MVCYKKVRIETRELQKPDVLREFINEGFQYMARLFPNSPSKFPTIGCLVELSHYKQRGSILIRSTEGKKLIKRISFF